MATPETYRPSPFVLKALITVGMGVGVVLAWQLSQLLLLIFLALLIATFWNALTRSLQRRLPAAVPRIVVLLGVVIGTFGVFGLVGALLARPIQEQFQELAAQLPEIVDALRETFSWVFESFDVDPNGDFEVPDISAIVEDSLAVIGAGFRGFAAVVGTFFIAFFLALTPGAYLHGVLGLVPLRQRDQARRLLSHLEDTVINWMQAVALSMLFVGLLVAGVLTVLGIPYALLFGLAAGILELIPFIGPFLAFLGPLAIALSDSLILALWVSLAYLVVQQIESNIIVPAVMAAQVQLPPALTVVFVVIMTQTFALVGAFLAAPLLACLMMTVRFAYGRA